MVPARTAPASGRGRIVVLLASVLPSPAAAAGCGFKLGFKAIADQIPTVVGGCLEDEHANPANGDALQKTTGGLLVWRKADDFTAFTDGYRSWVNGPYGLQQRLNTETFEWEGKGAPPPRRLRATDPDAAELAARAIVEYDAAESRAIAARDATLLRGLATELVVSRVANSIDMKRRVGVFHLCDLIDSNGRDFRVLSPDRAAVALTEAWTCRVEGGTLNGRIYRNEVRQIVYLVVDGDRWRLAEIQDERAPERPTTTCYLLGVILRCS
jgi:hypothetical protein